MSKESFADIGFSIKRFKKESLFIGIVSAGAILAFMQLVFFPILEYFVVFEETDFELYDFLKENKFQFYLIIIMGWLIGGFYEEIVFHGFIFTRLEKMIKGKYAYHISFAITAAIFGAYHFPMGPLGLINALIVGTVYLFLFLYFKRNLWYSIITHGIYNTLVITLIYYEF